MASLLIVDDNSDVRQHLKWGLSQSPYDIHFAKDAKEAMEVFRKVSPGVVTLDLGLPPRPQDASQGYACLAEMLALRPATKVIVITGFDERGNARRAVEMGAFDFFRKPIDLSELKVMIRRAFHLLDIEQGSGRRPLERVAASKVRYGIVCDCQAMSEVIAIIEKVANSDAPVLICGESGTGKELVAKAVHQLSPRCKEPLVSINCGAIPENLLESEFFGHERGAFTGATSTVKGKVEYADKGTLFLDEIGELPVNLQVKLLRFLQEMRIQRVGGRKTIEVNARVLAATNINIKEAMGQGKFREDLYYRIGVVTIMLPPLRERGDDVLLLAQHFLEQHGKFLSSQVDGFTPEALAYLKSHAWPGNVRELDNKIRRAILLAGQSRITPDDLGGKGEENSRQAVQPDRTLREARAQLERQMVVQALKRFAGNIVRASEALGVSRPTFYDLMRKHDVDSDTCNQK
jgi:two-component system NtrC family response regulator